MFGKNPHLNALRVRKQLLLAESELNRVHLTTDLTTLKLGIRSFTVRSQSMISVVSSTIALVTGLAAFNRDKPAEGASKPSWVRRILKTAGLISTIWLALRARNRGKEGV